MEKPFGSRFSRWTFQGDLRAITGNAPFAGIRYGGSLRFVCFGPRGRRDGLLFRARSSPLFTSGVPEGRVFEA